MALKAYPLNDTDYTAEDAQLYTATRTSGVYADNHFNISVTGADNDVTIKPGIGWMKLAMFQGIAVANDEDFTINAGVPDSVLPRIDAVVYAYDANANEPEIIIKQGEKGTTPTPPAVVRDDFRHELHLYHIRRRPGATAITPGDITDLRMDANYCGLMADSVTQVDMSAINAQIREFITDWENQIANVTDGKMIESPEYPGCYYRMNRGVKEWLNPPMMEDVEYATTKRQDGKRVYTKLLKARDMAGYVELTDVELIVSIFAVAEKDWDGEKLMFQLPVSYLPKDAPTIQKMQVYYRGNYIEFESVTTIGLYNLYITVEYTKLGDEVAYTNVTADGDTLIVETSGDVSAQGDNLNVEMSATVSADGGAYIRRLTINGVAYDLAVGQAGNGAPGIAYPGIPGMFYTDLDSGEVYVCTSGSPDLPIYHWRSIIPSTLNVKEVKLLHNDGIRYAAISATRSIVNIQNGESDAIIRGIATPVEANDVANKQYVDSKISGGGLGYYSATDHGAKGDGATDDSPALNALVQTVHNAGGGTIWLPKGTYMLDSPIIWASNVSLRGEGIGISMLKTRQAAGVGEGFAAIRGRKVTHFTADNPCENATFEQFTIDGSEMNITQYTSWPKGINIHYMRNSVFRDLEIRNTKATGLGIDMLENVTIDGIFLYNCGAGAYVDNAEINEGGAGIGIGTWGMPQESFIIRNCVADGCGRYGIFLERQGGTSDNCVANYIIANNIVKNGRKHGIVVKGGSRVNVTGNVVYNNAQYGMAVLENNGFLTDAVKFSGNMSYDNGVGFAVDTEGAVAEDIFCTENVISGCDTGVLILSSVDGLTVAWNTIKRCTDPVVIEGGSQHNFVYRDNILLDNGGQPRATATFTGCTDYIDELETGHPTRVEIPATDLILGIKIMPDGSEAADAVAQSTGYIDVLGMGGTVTITTTAETWDSKDSARVAQYGADRVCLQDSAPTYSVSDNNPNELTVELLSGCAYIRIFYGAGADKTVPAALTSVVVEAVQ